MPHPRDDVPPNPGGPEESADERQARERREKLAHAAPSAGTHQGEGKGHRVVTESEREAGTPDPRATTDWTHGEGGFDPHADEVPKPGT
jgi:hypothetical protein